MVMVVKMMVMTIMMISEKIDLICCSLETKAPHLIQSIVILKKYTLQQAMGAGFKWSIFA